MIAANPALQPVLKGNGSAQTPYVFAKNPALVRRFIKATKADCESKGGKFKE